VATGADAVPLNEIQPKLGSGRSMVYQLINDGRLPSVKIGSRRFVTGAALHAYVDGLGGAALKCPN
jgi:excisionase family DNA binding protein